MNKKILIPKQTITVDSQNRILKDHIFEITDNIITNIAHVKDYPISEFSGEIIRAENLTLIPGFVQTHVHLCQTLFRGLADDLELLDWLQLRIFPYENAHNKNSLRTSVQIGINELFRSGTTTLLDMGTLRHQEVIFDELINSGMRAAAGKCIMDENDLFPEFKSSSEDELKYTLDLSKHYHNQAEGRIKFSFSPRFALSTSEKLLKEIKQLMNDFPGSIYHTHSSENINEIEEVRKKYSKENIDFFDSINVLDDHTVLAHCVHVNDSEINILKKNQTRVAHCPSSNLKLGSGFANIPRFLKEGIPVSLGADGAPCNNNLSQFKEMKLASLIQKPVYGPTAMDAETVFRLATIEGAKALHLENEIGSIEIGKKADLVFLDLENPYQSLANHDGNIYSNIVYSASRENVEHVMVDGKFVVKNGISQIYDDNKLFEQGQKELKQLLDRV